MRMFLTPMRFWGHPDSWSDAAWDEYMQLTSNEDFVSKAKCFFWGL